MRAVVQRVNDCSVTAEGVIHGHIDNGLLVYLAVGGQDTDQDCGYMADKIINLRIFADEQGKMNRSVRDIRAEIMVVSQFTLYGDARRGRRPSYTAAADPEKARHYYEQLIERLRMKEMTVESGQFAARMEVAYTNVGPVTILLDSEKRF